MTKKHTAPAQAEENETEVASTESAIEFASHDQLIKQLNEAEQKANDYWERILRMQAEADNLKRRMERDVTSAHKYALEKFAGELLPIIDSLELALTSVPANMQAAAQSVTDGVNLTLKLFYNVLDKFNIKQVDPVMQPFNAEYHQAISMQADASVAPGTVVSVMQKGYTLNDRLIRPALVVVSKARE